MKNAFPKQKLNFFGLLLLCLIYSQNSFGMGKKSPPESSSGGSSSKLNKCISDKNSCTKQKSTLNTKVS
ncbi:MAG: hypothetical protein VYD54_03710, partial [Bdellovibrionota bacterium]|nr:hypothetical protein [Bdellovibrionota bacterium]